jgi:outer membrane protein assembly factor BamE (lipoprotein component of BamABCDE complex)
MRGRARLGAAIAATLLLGPLGACAPIYRTHGYAPTEGELASLALGQDTRESVAATVGRPSTEGVLEQTGFYYVESRFLESGLFAQQEVSREVLALSFAADGTLGAVERFGLADGRVVPISRRTTPGVFADPSVIARIFSNFGGVDTGALLGEDVDQGP